MAKPTEQAVEASKPKQTETRKGTVKTVHMHAGVELLGSATSISNKKAELIIVNDDKLGHGIMAASHNTPRRVVIPWANIRGYELL